MTDLRENDFIKIALLYFPEMANKQYFPVVLFIFAAQGGSIKMPQRGTLWRYCSISRFFN